METNKVIENIHQFLKESDEYMDYKVEYILADNNTREMSVYASNGDSLIKIDPSTLEINEIADLAYAFDTDVFSELQNGKNINYMSMETHYNIWNEIEMYYPSDIENKDGLNIYLKYCKDNNINKSTIDNTVGLDTPTLEFLFKESQDNIINGDSEIKYIAFVMGYDLLNDMLAKSTANECDRVYDFCNYLANKFIDTDYYKNEKYSTYEMLDSWINDNKDIIKSEYLFFMEIENKVILKNGFRKDQAIALIEKSIGNDKEYVIAFYYKVDEKKLDWGYGYYYGNDKEKANVDFDKVINGGNLSRNFEVRGDR